jgi:hypothetical protein
MAFHTGMQGHAVTTNHIVVCCKEVRIQGHSDSVRIIARDVVNDLSLLKLPGDIRAAAVLTPVAAGLRQGQEIVVFSIAIDSMLSLGGNLTPGEVRAITSLGHNSNQILVGLGRAGVKSTRYKYVGSHRYRASAA